MAINTRSVFMKASVVRSSSVSLCTALEHKQVNSYPYSFSSFLFPSCTMKGPRQSMPQYVKGGDASVLSSGRSDIFLTSVVLLYLLHFTHLRILRSIFHLHVTHSWSCLFLGGTQARDDV